jgi:lycopene cyclase domain-containing protein
MKQYTYLLVNFLTVIVCLIFSFDKRIRFNGHFAAFLKSAVLVSVPFIGWDIWFTHSGLWWFNHTYTMGKNVAGLPVEEWLFFICVPFSCVFTFYCLDKFLDLSWADRFSPYLVWLITITCIIVVILYYDRTYPVVTALATSITLVLLQLTSRANLIGRATLVYLLLLPGFLAVNGVLTGTGLESPVVNYNPNEIINVRIGTIPVEDFLYGFTLFVLNLYLFSRFSAQKKSPAGIMTALYRKD